MIESKEAEMGKRTDDERMRLIDRRVDRMTSSKLWHWWYLLSFGLLILLFVVGILLVLFSPFGFALLWDRFHVIQPHWWARLSLTIVLTLMGFCFFTIRENYRDFYGLAEVVMGIVGLWVVLANTQASLMTMTIALAGAVYFIVRGLDNFVKGRKNPTSIISTNLFKPVDNSSGQD
jgi:hypothetical protein